MTLGSGGIRFMRIFAEVPGEWESNDSVVVDKKLSYRLEKGCQQRISL